MKPLILFLVPIMLLSVPTNWKEIKTFTQPDGSQFEGRLIGDEHYMFVEDLDGYVLVRNAQGWWAYASLENGLLKPTANIAFLSSPVAPPHIRPSAEAIAKLPSNRDKSINRHFYSVQQKEEKLRSLGKENASYEEKAELLGIMGTLRIICLLGAFSDSGFNWRDLQIGTPYDHEEVGHFWGLVLGDSTAPRVADSTVYSVNNYFWEASYGKCHFSGDIDTIRGSGVSKASAASSPTTYITGAINAANTYVNFANFDCIVVIHPGYGQEESGSTSDIGSATFFTNRTLDGKLFYSQSVVPENGKIGVFCHELFHQSEFANAPDLYDYDYDGQGVDAFCLMASGSWNGDPGGTKPPHPCAYLKYDTDGSWGTLSGWLGAAAVYDTAELTTGGKYYITQLDSPAGTTLDYARMYMVQNTVLRDSGQLFMLENRQLTGKYESGLPRAGLVIYHRDGTDMSTGRYNNGPSQYPYYRLFTERNLFDPNWYYYAVNGLGRDSIVNFNPNDFYAPYAAELGFTNFDSVSIPNCGVNWRSNSSPPSWGPRITGISALGYNMSFNVARLANPGLSAAVKVHSYAIKDPLTTGYNNDNNTYFNAGELDTLVLTLYSSGANATGVSESLYTTDPYVTITNPAKRTIGSMSNNTFATDAANPYLIRIAFNTPPYYTAQFKYKIWASPTGNDSGMIYIPVNPANILWRFRPGALTHRCFTPMAIVASYDTIFVSDGDSLPPLAGTWRLYKFNTATGSLITSADRPGTQSYIGAGDIKGDTLFWSIGDSCVRTGRSLARINAFRHNNSTWGSNIRARGVSIAPIDAPTVYGSDSLFVYWQNYGATNDIMEESLKMVSRPTSGTSAWRRSWVIPEGTTPPQDHWRNGRGLEHDGWRIWRICLFTSEIYRGRAPVSTSTSIDTLFSMRNPNHWGSYPGYDIDFQAKNSSGGEPHTPYAGGNKFYLWTTNIESSELFKLDVTSVVLPSPVENVTVTRTGGSNYVTWDEKNYGTNPDTVEKVTKYKIFRTHELIMDQVGELVDSVTARSTYTRDTFIDVNPPARATTVYYRVSAVNWFGYIPGHSNRSGGVIGIEDGSSKPLTFMFYTIAPSIASNKLSMKYEIAEPCDVELKVYNSMGALVRTMAKGSRKAGVYNLVWDLKDNEKRTLANGIYFVRFETDKNYERTQKIVLVR